MSNEETQMDIQEEQPQEIPDPFSHMDEDAAEDDEPTVSISAPKKKLKQPVQLTREPGKSLFPFSRVQRIIKADKDIPIMAKDATVLISLATEEFVKRLCQEAHRIAEREKRTMVHAKDIATIARKADEFLFLEEILSHRPAEQLKRKPKALAEKEKEPAEKEKEPAEIEGSTLIDHFAPPKKTTAETNESGSQVIVMNDDGTMEIEPSTAT
ncbi:hypothetical protein E1B28_012589 [Marasmius oreades]|uniref:Transcription factor CBF/NF-Y/archaeal histone domain-containing protein n=1 Tax=Marasmius oreades TaxID=181124 RepID=A0A9P7RSL2_9AGAR|nr:uncharacterized protein E1B28_012589 [Marasmius oreades]KAG7088615.1 hypothetical protein E1B28_012589 [Marasmius oreades]